MIEVAFNENLNLTIIYIILIIAIPFIILFIDKKNKVKRNNNVDYDELIGKRLLENLNNFGKLQKEDEDGMYKFKNNPNGIKILYVRTEDGFIKEIKEG